MRIRLTRKKIPRERPVKKCLFPASAFWRIMVSDCCLLSYFVYCGWILQISSLNKRSFYRCYGWYADTILLALLKQSINQSINEWSKVELALTTLLPFPSPPAPFSCASSWLPHLQLRSLLLLLLRFSSTWSSTSHRTCVVRGWSRVHQQFFNSPDCPSPQLLFCTLSW